MPGCGVKDPRIDLQGSQLRFSQQPLYYIQSSARAVHTYDTPSTLCLKNDTDVAHYNFNAHAPILVILAEMLLREYAIEW